MIDARAAGTTITERRFQQQVVRLAELLRWTPWHDRATNAPRACPHCKRPLSYGGNAPGWPDLFLLRGDTLVVAELKSQRGRLTDPQRDWLAAFRRVRRVVVAVWRPSDWPEVERCLR